MAGARHRMEKMGASSSESLELIYAIQRELSLLNDPADLVATFVGSVAKVLPLSRMTYVLPWPPAVRRYNWIPGEHVPVGSLGYRLLIDIDLTVPHWQEKADFRSLFRPRIGSEPDAVGGILGEITNQHLSLVRNDLSLSPTEPGLGAAAARHRSMVAVPIFWQGHTQAWIVAFADTPHAFEPDAVRLLLTSGNMLARSAVYLDTLEEAKLANARLHSTFDEIGRVQRSLLPKALPNDSRLKFATSYITCDAAGGDYYDVHEPDDNSLDLVIADVSGHGPVASVAMAMLRTAMQSWCRGGHAPHTVVPQMNDLMLASLDEGMFITACFLNLDRQSGTLEFINCGHNPPILRRRDGEVEVLDGGGGLPLGVSDTTNATKATCTMTSGDVLVLYTDGIPEAFSPSDELFGMPRLIEAIRRGGDDPDAIKRSVLEAVDRHAAGRPRLDDQTLMVMSYSE